MTGLIKIFLSLIFAFIFGFLFSGISHANLVLREPSLKLFLSGGQNFNGRIILENNGSEPLLVSAESVSSFDKAGRPEKRSSSKWIKLEESEFVIPPKSIKDLKFVASVPVDAKGGFWSGIMYSYYAGSAKGPEGITLNFKMHIEEPVYVTVLNTLEKKLSVISLDAVYRDGNLSISSIIKNTGNIFEEINAIFLIEDSEGNIIDSIKNDRLRTYPGEEYNINIERKIDLKNRKTKIIGIFEFEDKNVKTAGKEIIIK